MPDKQAVADAAVPLIKQFEGCKLKAYPDPATGGKPWTIGYGATGTGIASGVTWTQDQAESDLNSRVLKLATSMLAVVKTEISADSFGALVSLTYNIGLAGFKSSTVLKRINTGDLPGAAAAILMWNKAAGKVNQGLMNRRQKEKQAFLDGLTDSCGSPVSTDTNTSSSTTNTSSSSSNDTGPVCTQSNASESTGVPTDPIAALAANNAAVKAAIEIPAGFTVDAEIEKLCLFGNAKLAAYTIRKQFGATQIKFTSGFRPIAEQIKAMAGNQVLTPTFLYTYAGVWQSTTPPDTWPEGAPIPAKTVAADGKPATWKKFSAKPLQEMFKWGWENNTEKNKDTIVAAWNKIVVDPKYTMKDRLAISKHAGGIAFDIQPLKDDAAAKPILDFIGVGTKAGTGTLPGKELFLTREAKLPRWHVQFTRSETDITYDDLLLWYNASRAKPGTAKPPAKSVPVKHDPPPNEPGEITIVGAGYGWSKSLTEEGAKVEVSIALKTDGNVVWTGAESEKPEPEGTKEDVKTAGDKESSAKIEIPILGGISSPTIEAGKDMTAFSTEWESKKKKKEKSLTIGERELFVVKFQTPGYTEPTIAIPIKVAAMDINLTKPLESAIGKLTGAIEIAIVSGDLKLSEKLKIKGGLSAELEVSTALVTFESLLKKFGVEFAEAAVETSEVVEGVATGGEVVEGLEGGAALASGEVLLTVGIVVVGVIAIAYICYELFESWEQDDTMKQLGLAQNATLSGFMDALVARSDNLDAYKGSDGWDQASYDKAHASGVKQRANVIAKNCKGNKAHLDSWLIANMDACADEVVKQFRASARKAAFENHAKAKDGSFFENSLSTLKDWWGATIQDDPKKSGFMAEWVKYRGEDPGAGMFGSETNHTIWTGDWSSL